MNGPGKSQPRWDSIPAWPFVVLYLSMLLLIPTELVFTQLGASGGPVNLLGLALLLWWICAKLGGQLPRIGFSPVHFSLGLLTLCIMLSVANGFRVGWIRPADIHEVTDELLSRVPIGLTELYTKSVLAMMRGLVSLGSWLGIALAIADGLRSWREFDRVLAWIAWLSAVVASIGIFQYFTGTNLAGFIQIPGLHADYVVGAELSRSVLNRVSATTTHPIEFGVMLTALFPLILHRGLRHSSEERKRSWTTWIPIILVGLAIPMSVSRSSIVALGVALLVLFLGWPGRRRLAVLVLLPPVLILMRSALPGLLGTIRALFTQSLTDPSVTARTNDWSLVFRVFREHPALGRGPFTFIPQYYRTLDNQFLANFLELGVAGILATLLLFGGGIYTAGWVRRHSTNPGRSHLGLSLAAGLAAIMVSYATFDAWGFNKAGGATFILLGLTAAAWRLTIVESNRLTEIEHQESRRESLPCSTPSTL